MNGIDFEEITIELKDNQQHTTEYKAINPMCQIPTIVDGDFTLFESHAILIYLACKFPGVASHWYPIGLLMRTTFGPVLSGIPLDHEAIEEAEKKLAKALSMIEDYWLKDGKILVGRSQPSIADLCLLSDPFDLMIRIHERIFSPYTKVVKWIEDTKSVIAPYFDEVHEKIFKAKITFQEQLAARSGK
ncbi:glutathione S-transferase T1 [Tanacetum coccineum]